VKKDCYSGNHRDCSLAAGDCYRRVPR